DEFAKVAVAVAKPVITPNGGTFAEPQTVTITADEGYTIYYTTDGTDPGMSPIAVEYIGTKYTEPFTISEDCTVKAIAYNEAGASSAIASAEFTFLSLQAITNIADLCAAAPAEGEADVLVEFNDWIVTGVKGKNAYFTDGKNGILLYQDKHNFELGDKITGSAIIKLTTYNECAEIKGLTKETEGITVEGGATAAPQAVAIADLQNDMQGCVIYLEGVTYDETAGVFVDDDDNTIKPYNTFIKLPELMDGKTYNVTGVAIWFATDAVWEIAPRTADEFVLVTSQKTPNSSWSVEEEIVDLAGTPTAVFTTDSDGEITYESSDESVAVIDQDGKITPKGRGITTITAFVAETENYLPDSKSFTLTVTKDGYADATFAYNDSDIEGQGAPEVGAEITATRDDIVTLYANRAYAKTGDTHIKVYGTNNTNGPSYLQLSVVDGYAITQIVLTATGKDNIKSWKDQFGKEAVLEQPDSISAIWTGMQGKVILTNQAGAQARIKYINVTFVKLVDTGKTVTIGESGYATYCTDTKAVLSQDGEWAIAGAVNGIGGMGGSIVSIDTLGTSVPSNTGVVLMGYRGEYKVYTHPDIEENYPTANLLVGVLEDTKAPVGSFVMDEVDVIPSFNVVAEGDDVTVPAGHAYLNAPNVVGKVSLFFTEDDYVTGIKSMSGVEQGTANSAIYNLAGQRMSKMQKGINIVDGKKVAVK
ncbi:MAG: chitobiase/beta-hexosaminidase C-terminal domain-containing protein, partial [Bacteroidaceae bacterium]|nr:chitobiase/beta-hexosaminidase C-terminal domain-containing protein [Bacteroidaceae bacterium]